MTSPSRLPGFVDEELAWLALAELGVRATAPWARCAAALGSARAVFDADPSALVTAGLAATAVPGVLGYDRWTALAGRRDACRRCGIRMATLADASYPALLRAIEDPPLVLYYRGRPPAEAEPAAAVVGARDASRYGRRLAARVACELAEAGVWVISGLAVGIDTEAHVAALGAGRSAAVLAGGFGRIYPACNRRLCARLAERGTVLTEYPPEIPSRGYHFPIRNRIITGMATATVVVEAKLPSGSLVSARLALDQGREVLAAPGPIDSPTSRGTNSLIRDGCAPLIEIDDVLRVYGKARAAAGDDAFDVRKALRDKGLAEPDMDRLVAVLDTEPAHLDAVAAQSGLDGARIMELLTTLELEGLAERLPGGTFALRGGLAHGEPR